MANSNFSERHLKNAGFTGWVPLLDLRAHDCPDKKGIYVVLYAPGKPRKFLSKSSGGWFKEKDPTVSVDRLMEKWVDGASVVYIGKASNLKQRLRQYADFGNGKPIGHRGGRFVWQLPKQTSLVVAWKETPRMDPRKKEALLIQEFKTAYGSNPFANVSS